MISTPDRAYSSELMAAQQWYYVINRRTSSGLRPHEQNTPLVIVVHRESLESNEMVEEGSVLSKASFPFQPEPPHPPLANRND